MLSVYLLSGTLPVEAQLHIRALSFFNNICNQEEKSIEKLSGINKLPTNSFAENPGNVALAK
jgi:hypothetical protein